MLKDNGTVKPIYAYDEWEVAENRFEAENNYRNETVFSLGNGYIGFRGNFEEGYPGPEDKSLEGIYINGFYESEFIKYPEIAYGYAEKSQTMLNVTNSRIIRLYIGDEEFNMLDGSMEEYRRVLSLKEGILRRSLVWCSHKGNKVKIDVERLVSLKDKHLAAIRYRITPVNFSGAIRIVSALDGNVSNMKSESDPRAGSGLHGRVLSVEENKGEGSYAVMVQSTENSSMKLACAMKNSIKTLNSYSIGNNISGYYAAVEYNVNACKGIETEIVKYISYVTSGEYEDKELSNTARQIVFCAEFLGYQKIKTEHIDYLSDFWSRSDVMIKGDPAIQQGIRFNMFHLLQSAGNDGKTSIGAKGLTGEGYEGHYFWDTEMYIMPFFLYSNPEICRKLLEYRYLTLDKARERARQMSHRKGALFPWRTINGEECSAYFPGGTAQYHINADIAFAVKRYMEATDDCEFLVRSGAEILFETARLWADLGAFIGGKGNKFCINGVTGPDEYTAIVNNNCYTNMIARVNLIYAADTAQWMGINYPDEYSLLAGKIGLDEEEPKYWRCAAENMYIPYSPELKVYLQDDSFLDKAPWDFSGTPADKYPLLLHFHPLVIYRHQVCKQADFVLALFLLGNMFGMEEKRINYDFYEKLTTHDSSLSTAIFSIVASEIGYREKAYSYFTGTARMDLDDYHGNTKDGIHAANMAGTWMCLVMGFAGMRTYDGILSFSPYIPDGWEEYSFHITFKDRVIKITVCREGTEYKLVCGDDLKIIHCGEERILRMRADERKEVEAVIFDLDGVIVSTDECHYRAWKRMADEEGIYFDRSINQRLRGVSRSESLEIILEKAVKNYTYVQKQELTDRKNSYYREYIQELTPQNILPGAVELLEDLRNEGIKTAIGSSSRNSSLILDRIGLRRYFDEVADGTDILKSKPHPEVFLKAAEKLGIQPENCVVIEDAEAGIEAALAAGMRVVGIGPAFENRHATCNAKNLTEISARHIANM